MLGEIRCQHAERRLLLFRLQQVDREVARHQRAVARQQHDFSAAAGFLIIMAQQHLQRILAVRRDPGTDGGADHLLQGRLEHLGKAPVGIQDHALRRQRQCAFAHFLDQQPVGPINALEREQLYTANAMNHQRIGLAAEYLAQLLFGLFKPDAQLRIFRAQLLLACRFSWH